MINQSFSFRQLFNSEGINYYSYQKQSASPDKYDLLLLKYKIFCVVWAIASLFHNANHNRFTENLTYFILTIAAIALIAKPSSVARLLIFISFQMYQAATDLPAVSNHWILTALVNLTIIHSFVYLIIKRKTFLIDKAELMETFSPLVKIELIILYFFAVFHKLNSGFFDTENSCAIMFLAQQNDYYKFLPSSQILLTLNIFVTLIVETLIPVLLCFRKTRYWGILIGLAFHWIIAYNPIEGFYNFSSTIFALYFIFTGLSFSEKIYQLYGNFKGFKEKVKTQLLQFKIINVVFFVCSILVLLLLVNYYTKLFSDYIRHIVWTVYSLGFIIIFMMTMATRNKEPKSRIFSYAHYSLLLFPVIVFLNGISPYLGLSTEHSYAMFSNLRTEGGVSNHYIVPASTQVFDYQKDVVEVVSSSDPWLQKMADDEKLLVFFQFRRHVRIERPANVTYIRNGVLHEFDLSTANSSSELLQKDFYAFEKFLNFRYFYKSGNQECVH